MTRWIRGMLLAMVLIIGLPVLLGADGCSGGLMAIDEKSEIAIGQDAMKQVEQQSHIITDTKDAKRIERIGKQLAAVTARPNLPWSYKLIEDKSVNAFALPGGPVYVTSGLMALNISDDELAAVLAHESAHINQRHSAKAMEQAMTLSVLSELALGRSSDAARQAVEIALTVGITLPHSRSAEYEADALGIRIAYNAGYPAEGMVSFMKRLDALPDMPKTAEWLSDHPATKARVERTTRIAAEVSAMARPVPIELSQYDRDVIKKLPTK